jgi:hypothetical protein
MTSHTVNFATTQCRSVEKLNAIDEFWLRKNGFTAARHRILRRYTSLRAAYAKLRDAARLYELADYARALPACNCGNVDEHGPRCPLGRVYRCEDADKFRELVANPFGEMGR